MVNKNLLFGSVILFLSISIIISGYLIRDAVKSVSIESSSITSIDTKVLNITQVAEYLNMSEEEIKSIIKIENKQLTETGSFYGKMFPYFTINNKQYFYKDEIDEWLKEVSSTHRTYNTIKGWLLQ